MAEPSWIQIFQAAQHNLKEVDCKIPSGKFTVITGLSGSGKSSLAYHTLYAEGQRRFVESLSAHARQFLNQLPEPKVRAIEGLRPAIAIEQNSARNNPRSIVATATEIHDFLRVLWSSCGVAHDPTTGEILRCWNPASILEELLEQKADYRALILAPLPSHLKADPEYCLREVSAAGFVRLQIDGKLVDLSEETALAKLQNAKESQIVIDRLILRDRSRERITDSLETALSRSPEGIQVAVQKQAEEPWQTLTFPTIPTNPNTGFRMEALTPQHFSFNSSAGACSFCQGIGSTLEPDATLLVPDTGLSLAEGALKCWWWSRKKFRATRLKKVYQLLKKLDIDHTSAWEDLPSLAHAVLLYGVSWQSHLSLHKSEKKPNKTQAEQITQILIDQNWEGALDETLRVYHESESMLTRHLTRRVLIDVPCKQCNGKRLNPGSLAVKLRSAADSKGPTIDQFLGYTVDQALDYLNHWNPHPEDAPFANPLLRELKARLGFLSKVGIGYISLDRPSSSLSGGENQRVRLATQIGGPLTGVLYVLDEPTIGLHPKDNQLLLDAIRELVARGNTVVAVEHDPEFWQAADWLIEIGPGPGEDGGNLVYQGPPAKILTKKRLKSPTQTALQEFNAQPSLRDLELPPTVASQQNPNKNSQKAQQNHNQKSPPSQAKSITVIKPEAHNLKGEDIRIPLEQLVCITGPSGSGKSTFVGDILHPALARKFHRSNRKPGKHEEIQGLEHLDRVVLIDQSALSGSSRSTAVTYCKAFDSIRALFAQLPESRQRGYTASRFSFNRPGGRCETCQGTGERQVDMQLLPPVSVPCASCNGTRYNRQTLEIRFKGLSLADVLELSVHQARKLFAQFPEIDKRLAPMETVGLGYLKLGQSSATFSGGEAQRLRLASQLALPKQSRTLFLLDEPTTGLHPQDIQVLLQSLQALIKQGHSIVVVEHQLDFIRAADWVIDLGPNGGDQGGHLVFSGPPALLARHTPSSTAKFL